MMSGGVKIAVRITRHDGLISSPATRSIGGSGRERFSDREDRPKNRPTLRHRARRTQSIVHPPRSAIDRAHNRAPKIRQPGDSSYNASRLKEQRHHTEGACVAKRSPLAEKLDQVRQRIADACAAAKREPGDVTLVAVTKSAAPEQVREIIQLGVTELGESRVQVLTQRAAQVNEFQQRRIQHGEAPASAKIRWHMIGHLQRNKAKPIIGLVHLIHSVDSLRLAEEIDTQSTRAGIRTPVLLQINASEEPSKFGVAVGASTHLAEQMDSMPGLQLVGLMTMGPLGAAPKVTQHCFARTREIFEEMRCHKIGGAGLRHLSMGMSDDFELAIAEGATMVRIGSALFGGNADAHDSDTDE
jgi:pyridoxal phosphate enzyme (YggS family)